MHTFSPLALILALFGPAVTAAQEAEQPEKYLLLATNRTGTMEEELNEAGGRGYRIAGAQGGETAFGGTEAVVVMALDPEGRRFRYILLATSRTGTMQEELNEAPPEYELVAMTMFRSTFSNPKSPTASLDGSGFSPPQRTPDLIAPTILSAPDPPHKLLSPIPTSVRRHWCRHCQRKFATVHSSVYKHFNLRRGRRFTGHFQA